MTLDKLEVMRKLNEFDVPCGPILDMREIAEERALRETGTVVEVDHPKRGKFLTVGNPIKLSDSPTEVKPSPALGEHTDENLEIHRRLERFRNCRGAQRGRGLNPATLRRQKLIHHKFVRFDFGLDRTGFKKDFSLPARNDFRYCTMSFRTKCEGSFFKSNQRAAS